MSNKFHFEKLDDRTRKFMVEEIEQANKADQVYFSKRFNVAGNTFWVEWLLGAAKEHDEAWLADQIDDADAMKHLEGREKPKGGYGVARVPDTAAETLSDGQFNRFYIAAVCRRAIEDGKEDVVVYRAKHRGEPRPESTALEGTRRNSKELLSQMRARDESLNSDLLKANSGLSVDY